MGDFLRLILDSIKFLWPFRIVMEWEEGCYYVFGRFVRKVGPGLYLVFPFFTEIREFPIVAAPVIAPRQDITLRDGSTLHFSLSCKARVSDIYLAVNTIDNYSESTQEWLMIVGADKLAEVDAERVLPERRAKLLQTLTAAVATEAATFGVEVTDVAFVNFVHKPRTYRLLMDSTVGMGSTW